MKSARLSRNNNLGHGFWAMGVIVLSILLTSCGSGWIDQSFDFDEEGITVTAFFPDFFGSTPTGGALSNAVPGTGGTGYDLLTQANVSWVRHRVVRWDKIEKIKNEREWCQMVSEDRCNFCKDPNNQTECAIPERPFINELNALRGKNISPSLIIFGSPSWATMRTGSTCAPPRSDKIVDFLSFVQSTVLRYKGWVKYWEIWNEPDVDINANTPGFGCWGGSMSPDPGHLTPPPEYQTNTYFWGGVYYADVMKQVYQTIKAADPSAQVIMGGLMMGCDADASGNCSTTTQSSSFPFLDGFLADRGGAAVDIIAFHSYLYWSDGPESGLNAKFDWEQPLPNGKPALNPIGPGYKLSYIRNQMEKYQVPHKPILMDEGAMLCPEYIAEKHLDYPFMKKCALLAYKSCTTDNDCYFQRTKSDGTSERIETGACLDNPYYASGTSPQKVCLPRTGACSSQTPCPDPFRQFCDDGTCQPRPGTDILCGRHTLSWKGSSKAINFGACPVVTTPGGPIQYTCVDYKGDSCTGSVSCPGMCEFPGYIQDQANEVLRDHIRLKSKGVDGMSWYMLQGNGWRKSDLVRYQDLSYQVLRTLAGNLKGATFGGALSDGSSASQYLEGYRMCMNNQQDSSGAIRHYSYRLYWRNWDSLGTPQKITLAVPPGTAAIFDKIGQSIPLGSTVGVGFEPVVMKLNHTQPCERTAFWNFDSSRNNEAFSSNGSDLTSVSRYVEINNIRGPCYGKQPGECHFDTRTMLVAGGRTIESITAYGKYFNFDGDAAWSSNGSDLTSVGRYVGTAQLKGPCYGKSAGQCKFDTRTIVWINNQPIESITAYGKYFNFLGQDPWTPWTSNGSDLTSVGLYVGNAELKGPCWGKSAGQCKFDTRTMVAINGQQVESITAYGKYFNFNTAGAFSTNGSNLDQVLRYADGPCRDQPAGQCQFDTRTIVVVNGRQIESITE